MPRLKVTEAGVRGQDEYLSDLKTSSTPPHLLKLPPPIKTENKISVCVNLYGSLPNYKAAMLAAAI